MGATATARGDQAAAAASSSIARVTAATRLFCRRKNIPPRTSSVGAPGGPLPAGRINATGRSGFKTTLSPESADAEQPQCSAFSVFLAFGLSGNGPPDSSFVHAYERGPTGESPAARYRALTRPAFTPCGRAEAGRRALTVQAPSGGRGLSVSPGYPSDAIDRTAGLALISLITRAAREPPDASGREASAGSPRRVSVRSPAR
jgi:hypothetical protein